jgi:hypothetical protein
MRLQDFEYVMSTPRMVRYRVSCGGNTQKAMTLYRRNLKLSQELFTIISCFEVTLRNAIDRHCSQQLGMDWLRDAVMTGGIFDNSHCIHTATAIRDVLRTLGPPYYSNSKLVAGLGFGFWRYLFSRHQYRATGQQLLNIFPARPQSTSTTQYNALYIFNELAQINHLRNRIAHHEPICFLPRQPVKDTGYARYHYSLLLQLFQWMSVNEHEVLYGLDHIDRICDEMDVL